MSTGTLDTHRATRAPLRTGTDQDALTTWLATRAAVVVLALAGSWTVLDATEGTVAPFNSLWNQWDVGLYVKIARWGYTGYPAHYPDRNVAAFFPGEPLVLRAVHLVVPNWIAAGLLVSVVAGAVAVVALARLAGLEDGPIGGHRAVLYLTLSPYAVFLFAGYSEPLFLAFALPAWLAGRRGRWRSAGLLAAAAAAVRITGLFLFVALAVDYLARRGRRRPQPEALWLLLPIVVVAAYFGYLHHLTGDWLAWSHAQGSGWGRHFTAPWRALHTTWDAAFVNGQGAAYAWSFRTEIVAMAVGLALTVWLLLRRRWGEGAYVGLQLAALGTSSFYLSVARSSLVWWPLWVGLASWSLGRRWLHVGYLALAAPLMAVGVLAFTRGHWVG